MAKPGGTGERSKLFIRIFKNLFIDVFIYFLPIMNAYEILFSVPFASYQ